ncbi:C-C motif chemokine 24 [Petaurus breviceps papuanus]|uniref:C-C motif chemokine 24 n=1 Tax=Petaurus breviceps papuanus TaxID=3040969 RepID=UPI0036DBDDDC
MKASIVILLPLLLMVICCPTGFAAGAAVVPSFCCNKYLPKAVSPNMLDSYHVTNRSVCSMPGVIFITKRGRPICGDPTKQWVKDLMKKIDAKKTNVSVSAGPKALKTPLRKLSFNSTTLDH